MTDYFYNFIILIANALGAGGIFLLLLSLDLICFTICILRVFLGYGYGARKRAWFYSVAFFSVCVQGAFIHIFDYGVVFLLLLVAISVLLITPVIVIPVRKIKCKKEQIDFARELDFKFKSQVEEQDTINQTVIEKSDADIDFSHVLGVIAKLEYYPLTTTEKKQVKDLTEVIRLSQSGKRDKETKIKITKSTSL